MSGAQSGTNDPVWILLLTPSADFYASRPTALLPWQQHVEIGLDNSQRGNIFPNLQ